jgi:hypothetical protein
MLSPTAPGVLADATAGRTSFSLDLFFDLSSRFRRLRWIVPEREYRHPVASSRQRLQTGSTRLHETCTEGE